MKHLSFDSGRPEALDRLERLLGRTLRGGLLLATALLGLGLTLWMAGAERAVALPLLHTGLVVLMATPVLRVIVSTVEFARTRDWFFVLVTIAVLAVLGGTIWVALVP